MQSITSGEATYRPIDGTLVLGPREAVNVEINEKFRFTDENGRPVYCGLIIAGARLLAGGVSHPTTAIDPGFSHTTTLTLENLRNFPSRAFRPGADRIAKLLVLKLDQDEMPTDGWEETPAYLQSGPEEPPALWADFHMLPGWTPVLDATINQLDDLRRHGPPFDVLAAHLREHRKQLFGDDGVKRTIASAVNRVGKRADTATEAIQITNRIVEVIKEAQDDLGQRLGGIADTVADIQKWRHAEQERHGAELEAARRGMIDSRRHWVIVLVTFAAAVLGSVLSIWLTLILTKSSSVPMPGPSVVTSSMLPSPTPSR
jgi:hypothetical protein